VNLRDSFNAASLTDGGTGIYNVTYTSAMSNDDYAHPLGGGASDFVFTRSTTEIQVKSFSVSGNAADVDPETFAIFGDLA